MSRNRKQGSAPGCHRQLCHQEQAGGQGGRHRPGGRPDPAFRDLPRACGPDRNRGSERPDALLAPSAVAAIKGHIGWDSKTDTNVCEQGGLSSEGFTPTPTACLTLCRGQTGQPNAAFSARAGILLWGSIPIGGWPPAFARPTPTRAPWRRRALQRRHERHGKRFAIPPPLPRGRAQARPQGRCHAKRPRKGPPAGGGPQSCCPNCPSFGGLSIWRMPSTWAAPEGCGLLLA